MPDSELAPAQRREQLAHFRHWLEAKGVRVAGTRFAKAQRVLERVESEGLQVDTYDEYLFSIREADELLWVARGVLTADIPGALGKLSTALGGAEFAKGDASSAARNALFELRIASYFAQAGFSVDMSTEADVVVDLFVGRLAVECKRVESRAKVQRRCKEALRQVQKRLGTQKKPAFGLVVLDIGQILHPGQGMAVGNDAITMRNGLRSELQSFIDSFNPAAVFENERRIASLWIQVLTPVIHLRERAWTTRFSSHHILLRQPDDPVISMLKRAFEVAPAD